MARLQTAVFQTASLFQRISVVLILLVAATCIVVTGLSATGHLPWLELDARFGQDPLPKAGMSVQIGVTVLAAMLLFYLPANARMMALETSHRTFAMTMTDVARAYHMAHSADRRGAFRLSAEFDAVKERIAFLRRHPELDHLEPELLELAAQMSQISHHLAETYSDAKVDRARAFLKQRQEEIAQFDQRLDEAKLVAQELRQWHAAVEMDEAVARSQLARLKAELHDILPELEIQDTAGPRRLIDVSKHAAE